MSPFELISTFSTFILPLIVLYLFMFIVLLGQRYIRAYTRNRILKFTQEEVKDKSKEISAMTSDPSPFNIIRVFSLYNELAVGINEGLYDELYINMVLGYDMITFYKKYYRIVASASDMETNLSRFMPLELLLKKWDSGGAPSYRFNKHRRYL